MWLSLDYARLTESSGRPLEARSLGGALLEAAAAYYQAAHGTVALVEFEQSGAVYLFDHASSAEVQHVDRTVATWTLTPKWIGPRDTSYQRGFPMPGIGAERPHDRGHLIPHLSGGEFGPNIFRQDRALNRGWDESGKSYRALERGVAREAGAFYFGHLIYTDHTDFPARVEIGVVHDGVLLVETFDNRPKAV